VRWRKRRPPVALVALVLLVLVPRRLVELPLVSSPLLLLW